MEKEEVHAITFRVNLNKDSFKETVYMSYPAFEKLPITSDYGTHDTNSIIPEYFTQEKINEFKKKICEEIMNTENPFSIYEIDLDGYPVDKNKIWK